MIPPFPCATLWDEADVRAHAVMTDAVHAHGALAGVELWHGGAAAMNRTTRAAMLSPSGVPWMATHVGFMSSSRPRIMDAADIRDLIRWHAEAAVRAERAGFDILYVYAGMGYLPFQFLMSDYNYRTDAYGGSVRNRVRLVEELIDAVREATHGRCAVALRLSMQELRARPSKVAASEGHEVITLLRDAPDLFDVKMDYSATDCAASRFTPEGSHEPVVDFVKSLTDKPVVGVGRFTSPDTMVGMIRRGVLDFIGGAHPSIADPFLPAKIDEGRESEIRECIGCNICISSWHDGVWVRCTQNPTAGEEWRRGWHPERVRKDGAGSVLVVGGGPAGLEAALTLARRGYGVALADREKDFGGRLRFETGLPGMKTWNRVAEYRLGQLRQMANVSLYPDSDLSAQDVLDFGAEHVVVATGARWLPLLCGANELPAGTAKGPGICTPDDLAAGNLPDGPVAVFDFDNYYLGTAIAEGLSEQGLGVTYVTTAGAASAWSFMTNEQPLIHQALARRGIGYRTLESRPKMRRSRQASTNAVRTAPVPDQMRPAPGRTVSAVFSPGIWRIGSVQDARRDSSVIAFGHPAVTISSEPSKTGPKPVPTIFQDCPRRAQVRPARQPRTSTTTRPCTSPFRMARPNSGSPARPTGRIIASSRSIGRSAAIRSQACTRAA